MVNGQYHNDFATMAIDDPVAAQNDLTNALLADLGNHPPGFREVGQSVDSLQDVRDEEPRELRGITGDEFRDSVKTSAA